MEIFIFLGVLFVLLAAGMAAGVALMVCAIVLLWGLDMFEPVLLAEQMLTGADSFILTTIPFFMLAGELMKTGGISQRLIRFGQLLVGRFRGGMGYVAILASILFAGMSGAAIADVSALGSILVPMMVACGYDKARSTGLICSASLTSPILPPSIPMIILAVTVELSIGRMFMMGIAPGFLLGVMLMIAWFITVRRDGYHDTVVIPREERLSIVINALPALFLPVILIVGIRFGVFTPTEAGAVACVYAFVVGILIHRELKFRDLGNMLYNAVRSSAIVMFVLCAATAIGWIITIAQVPQQIVSHMQVLVDSPFALLIALNLWFLFIGMVLDITPLILIFAPVVFPLVKAAGIDPYYFGIIMIVNLCIGLTSPPIGSVLYVGCSVSKLSVDKLIRGISPFLITELIFLALLIIFPQIVTAPAAWLGFGS